MRCDCFTEDIVQDDDQYTEMLIPNKNDVSNVTESTAGESEIWDEDDILVHDAQTNQRLPQQEETLFFGMLAPVASKGVMDLVDMAKSKFMSSSETNYPSSSSQTGSSLVAAGASRVEISSWSNKVAANLLRNKRQKAQSRLDAIDTTRTGTRTRTTAPLSTTGNHASHPTGPYLLGIAFPHPAYMSSSPAQPSSPPPPPPPRARYFKTTSNVHHPHEELVSKKTKVVRI
ncbi:MAG: hypothetical protein SGBAC_008495 [Bacillariaceae sp.]